MIKWLASLFRSAPPIYVTVRIRKTDYVYGQINKSYRVFAKIIKSPDDSLIGRELYKDFKALPGYVGNELVVNLYGWNSL